MLRIILCVFILLLFNYNNLSSQIVRLSGGINRTWMNEKPFDTPCLTYTGSLGYDYLLDRDYHDWFYLSSEIGYVKRSGKNAVSNSKLNMDHLHLNTLFKVKYSFIGIIPAYKKTIFYAVFILLKRSPIRQNRFGLSMHKCRFVFGL